MNDNPETVNGRNSGWHLAEEKEKIHPFIGSCMTFWNWLTTM